MKASFDDEIIRENMRRAIAEFCRLSINKGKCDEGDCEFCPVNHAYDMARDEDDGLDEFE